MKGRIRVEKRSKTEMRKRLNDSVLEKRAKIEVDIRSKRLKHLQRHEIRKIEVKKEEENQMKVNSIKVWMAMAQIKKMVSVCKVKLKVAQEKRNVQ